MSTVENMKKELNFNIDIKYNELKDQFVLKKDLEAECKSIFDDL